MFKNILVAIDHPSEAETLAGLVTRCARPGTRIRAVYVVGPSYGLPEPGGTIARLDQIDCPAATLEQVADGAAVHGLLEVLERNGLFVEGVTVVMTGEPAAALAAEAHRNECDLLIIGHRSVCFRVLETALCPVLVDTQSATRN
jgi:nucleotide-binding universal stress UspA family protein